MKQSIINTTKLDKIYLILVCFIKEGKLPFKILSLPMHNLERYAVRDVFFLYVFIS